MTALPFGRSTFAEIGRRVRSPDGQMAGARRIDRIECKGRIDGEQSDDKTWNETAQKHWEQPAKGECWTVFTAPAP